MSLIDSLKEKVVYLRKENIIKIEIINSLTEKNQLNAPVLLQNEHPNSVNLVYHWQITKR